MKNRQTRKVVILIFSACLLWVGNAFGVELRTVSNLRNEAVIVPVSAPNRDELKLLNYVTFAKDTQMSGWVAFYDDPETKRDVDYLELYDTAGNLLIIGWLDRFGITRTAVDLGLVGEDAAEVRRILLLIPEGELS